MSWEEGTVGSDGEDGADASEDEVRDLLREFLSDPAWFWRTLVGPVGPLRGARHLQQLTIRVVEFVEMTNAFDGIHPHERPLESFLAPCVDVRGYWRLDTAAEALHLERMSVVLPMLPLVDDDGAEEDLLIASLWLVPPGGAERGPDHVMVASVARHDALAIEHWGDAVLPVLAVAVREHLVEGLATATVLSRAPEGPGGPDLPAADVDTDPDAAPAADRLVELLAGLEDALARRAAAGRGPEGDVPGDAEVERHLPAVLADVDRVLVDVHQRLPAGTLEPVRLHLTATTGEDPDGLGVLPLSYTLRLDLVAGLRGSGVVEVDTWAGGARRAVMLPHLTDLWTDHVDSALRRAHAVVPAVRRSPLAEFEDPVPVVGPPGEEDRGREALLAGLAGTAGLSAVLDDVPF